jgi:hypothetical protein
MRWIRITTTLSSKSKEVNFIDYEHNQNSDDWSCSCEDNVLFY